MTSLISIVVQIILSTFHLTFELFWTRKVGKTPLGQPNTAEHTHSWSQANFRSKIPYIAIYILCILSYFWQWGQRCCHWWRNYLSITKLFSRWWLFEKVVFCPCFRYFLWKMNYEGLKGVFFSPITQVYNVKIDKVSFLALLFRLGLRVWYTRVVYWIW